MFLSLAGKFHLILSERALYQHVCITSLLKTLWEKEKLLDTSNFSFSHSVFNPFGELNCQFHQISTCCEQTLPVWMSLKFVLWERVNSLRYNLEIR